MTESPTPLRAHAARVLLALVCVVTVGVVLQAAHTDRAAAALVFAAVVVLMSLLGRPSAAVSAIASFLVLNYWFIPTTGTFTFESAEDLLPLVAFAFAGTAAEQVATRVHALRHRAAQNEQAALDAKVDAAVNEARAGFLAAMTHNLRTPLASIKSAASTLRSPAMNARPEVRNALLDTVADETARLERLVTKVLDMSRIHGGSLQPETEPTALADLARGALRRVRQIAAGRVVELTADDDPVEVDADPHMIELALVSLLENALRFAPPDTPVTVVTRRSTIATGEIRVVDHGPGVPSADRERVFEDFVRLGEAPANGGAGLGLSIARAFVDAHEGTIAVEETAGGGATFVVTLPLASEPAMSPALTLVSTDASGRAPERFGLREVR